MISRADEALKPKRRTRNEQAETGFQKSKTSRKVRKDQQPTTTRRATHRGREEKEPMDGCRQPLSQQRDVKTAKARRANRHSLEKARMRN